MNSLLILLLMLVSTAHSVAPFVVDGPSMEPTLSSGQLFFVQRDDMGAQHGGVSVQHGDIVVFSFEDKPAYFYVKRVIGLPGDRVQIREDGVYLSEQRVGDEQRGRDELNVGDEWQKIPEPYLPEGASSVPVTGKYRDYFRQTFAVPSDKIFVMGDNREHSLDSRFFQSPFVPLERVVGRFLFAVSAVGGDAMESEVMESTVDAGDAAEVPDRAEAVFRTDEGEVTFDVEVVRTREELAQGLMYRTELAPDAGMLFLFEEPQILSFWMKNTLIPLDMIFLDEDWKVVNIVENAVPCAVDPCPSYHSEEEARYVLEVAAGRSRALGIGPGDVMTYRF